jgi:hypothetical protein
VRLEENWITLITWGTPDHELVTYGSLFPPSLWQSSIQRLPSGGVPSDIDIYGLLLDQDRPTDRWIELAFDSSLHCSQIRQTYRSDAEIATARARLRLFRKVILTCAVSKAGHLSFLVPRYKQVSAETIARDEAVHFEGITLAQEHERVNLLTEAIQTLNSGWSVCKKRLRNCLLILASPPLSTSYGCSCIDI